MIGDKQREHANGLAEIERKIKRLEEHDDQSYAAILKLDESLRAVLTALGDMKVQLANAIRIIAAADWAKWPLRVIAACLVLLTARSAWQVFTGQ